VGRDGDNLRGGEYVIFEGSSGVVGVFLKWRCDGW